MPSPKSLQDDFYNRLAPEAQIGGLFDAMPSVLYFVKDRESRFISVNRSHLDWLQGADGEGVTGRTDADFFPPELVDQFLRSDHRVFESGQPLVNLPEVNSDRDGHQEWFITTKQPLFDQDGEVIGLAGFTQSREQLPSHAISNDQLREAIELIRANQDRLVSLEEMASVAGMSERQLYRKFEDAFHTTPVRFALLTRLRAARQALVTRPDPISSIALEFGFYDQSAFTKQFKKELGKTPSAYRRGVPFDDSRRVTRWRDSLHDWSQEGAVVTLRTIAPHRVGIEELEVVFWFSDAEEVADLLPGTGG